MHDPEKKKARWKRWWLRNLDQIRQMRRKNSYKDRKVRRRWEENNREKRQKIAAKYAAKNPEKPRAYAILYYALKTGKLTRSAFCQHCGLVEKTQGHHHKGYSKENQLNVVWLCKMCHKFEHRKQNGK